MILWAYTLDPQRYLNAILVMNGAYTSGVGPWQDRLRVFMTQVQVCSVSGAVAATPIERVSKHEVYKICAVGARWEFAEFGVQDESSPN